MLIRSPVGSSFSNCCDKASPFWKCLCPTCKICVCVQGPTNILKVILKLRFRVGARPPVFSMETWWLSLCKLILPVIRHIGRWTELLLSSHFSPLWHERIPPNWQLSLEKCRFVHSVLLWHYTNTLNLQFDSGEDGELYPTAGFEVVYSVSGGVFLEMLHIRAKLNQY